MAYGIIFSFFVLQFFDGWNIPKEFLRHFGARRERNFADYRKVIEFSSTAFRGLSKSYRIFKKLSLSVLLRSCEPNKIAILL
jgi:hypothetical protein